MTSRFRSLRSLFSLLSLSLCLLLAVSALFSCGTRARPGVPLPTDPPATSEEGPGTATGPAGSDGTTAGTPDVPEQPRYSEGLAYRYFENGGYYIVTGIGTCRDTDLSIPPTHSGKPVSYVDDGAFRNCTSLRSVRIPKGLRELGRGAFEGCTSLTELTLPFVGRTSNIDYFSGGWLSELFGKTTSPVKKLILTDLTQLPDNALSYCSSLESVTLPDTLRRIGKEAFYGCSKLRELTIPAGVYKIGTHTVAYCSSLTTVRLLAKIAAVPESFAEGSRSLQNVTLDSGITQLDKSAFKDCTSLRSDAFLKNIRTFKEYSLANCGFETFTVPDGVTEFDPQAIRECKKLKTLIIGKDLRKINKEQETAWPFPALQEVRVDPGNTVYAEIGNGLVERATKTLLIGGKNTVIPDDGSVTRVGGAFAGNLTITSFHVPASVTLMKKTFFCCKNLETVTFGGGPLTLDYAFESCPKLKTVVLPEATVALGNGAFYGCTALRSVNVGGAKTIGEYCFQGCKNLTEVDLGSVRTVGFHAFFGCEALPSIRLPRSLQSIDLASFDFYMDTLTFTYDGTIEEWDAVSKTYALSYPRVTCSDGVWERPLNK